MTGENTVSHTHLRNRENSSCLDYSVCDRRKDEAEKIFKDTLVNA